MKPIYLFLILGMFILSVLSQTDTSQTTDQGAAKNSTDPQDCTVIQIVSKISEYENVDKNKVRLVTESSGFPILSNFIRYSNYIPYEMTSELKGVPRISNSSYLQHYDKGSIEFQRPDRKIMKSEKISNFLIYAVEEQPAYFYLAFVDIDVKRVDFRALLKVPSDNIRQSVQHVYKFKSFIDTKSKSKIFMCDV